MLRKLNRLCLNNWQNITLLALVLLAAVSLLYIYVDAAALDNNMPEDGKSVIDIPVRPDYGQISTENQKSMSAVYASITPNQTEWTSDEAGLTDGIFCITTENAGYMLYDIDSSNIAGTNKSISGFNNIWINSQSDSFYAVLNISGKNINLEDYYILVRDETGLYGSRAVLNFYEAETLNIKNAIIMGTVLAPDADISCEGATIYGQLHGASISGELKYYRDMRFTGYRGIVENLDVLNVVNDSVRIAAIQYLVNNDPGNLYADYTLSSMIRTKDAANVKSLEINSQGEVLESLSEDLSLFTNVEEITINGGEFSSLSLQALSGIKSLTITGTTISELDISSLTKLERLVLDKNTELKTLDFTNNTNLKILSYSGTPLGWMDYSALPELYYLDCSKSNVQENVIVSGEKMPSMRMLDISGNSNIQTFYIQTFPKLECVNCSSCTIIELDFSNSTALTYFKGSYNRIRNIDFRGANNLKFIEAYGASVESIDLRGLNPEKIYCTAEKITD